MSEKWRVIRGYEDYSISNTGTVRSRRNMPMGKWRELKCFAHGKRYLGVTLFDRSGSFSDFLVHRLVAMAFLGQPSALRNRVNHKDGNGKNNRVENLEWCSQKENMIHAARVLGTCRPIIRIGSQVNTAKLTEQDVAEIKTILVFGPTNMSSIAKRYGVYKSTIYRINNGKSWKHVNAHPEASKWVKEQP